MGPLKNLLEKMKMMLQLSIAPEMSRRPPVKGDKAQSKEKRPVKEEMCLSGKVMKK